ncbi:MAG: extracellular solute-binding protein [bacterium]|nr:extracellular solute-binding protein [bacterium]
MRKLFFIFPLLATLIFSGAGCTKGVSPAIREASRPVVLNWWSPFLDSASVKPVIEAYRAIHPNVTINFRKSRYEDYEKELLNALAEDSGPDIFSLHNTWVNGWRTKLLPMPKSVTLPFQQTSGTLKKEVVTVLRASPTLGVKGVKNNFVDVVASDVILPSQDPVGADEVYGLPMSLDTLALYYNKDILNLAGIPTPPRTWSELQGLVKKITKLDADGKIIQSGAALGTARNVERASDIMALLMMQNGAAMENERGQVAFDKTPASLKGRGVPPGEEALIFYTDFANPSKEIYSWNSSMPGSLEAFAQGKTAFFLGYSYHLPVIKNMSPKLNFTAASVPQIEGNPEVGFANYWVEGISKKTNYADFAWDFIQFATAGGQTENYLQRVKKPTALRSLVVKQGEDLDIGVFASQVLRAKSWYHGVNATAAMEAILQMIESVNRGDVETKEAIYTAAQKVGQTYK